ncbi:MAG TPA: hypothetical protein VF773_08655 [Verrucomicrobiae bacterium]
MLVLERELGFRSSFNFIPEGPYQVSQPLIDRIKSEGFEVGVHDLHHNGKLYRNKKRFDAAAPRINKYLREWGAVGFRSGFMHRNLDWLHALDIAYDMSTFDTDPFEPQPEGAHTIFPFWVPEPGSTQRSTPTTQHSGLRTQNSDPAHHSVSTPNSVPEALRTSNFEPRTSGSGYAELPYTLPQDSTLFLLLRENDISIWKKKIDWIAERGGMALINVHPDYLHFPVGTNGPATFSVEKYKQLLEYVRGKYDGAVAYMLPREVASLVRPQPVAGPALSL